MNQNNIIFSSENILDTMGISHSDDYAIEFERDYDSYDITANLIISTSKTKECSYSSFLMGCTICENSNNPGFMALLKTNIQADGSVTLKVGMNSPKMIELMKLINQYVKFFMIISTFPQFQDDYSIEITITADYTHTDTLTLNCIHLSFLSFISRVKNKNYGYQDVTTNIENTVDEYLLKIGRDKLCNEMKKTTNMDLLFEQVKMQKIIDEMVRI